MAETNLSPEQIQALLEVLRITPQALKPKDKAALFASQIQHWETPANVFEAIQARLGLTFNLDTAAAAHNAKCIRFFTEADNGLEKSWANAKAYTNSPYGPALPHWVKKCWTEVYDPPFDEGERRDCADYVVQLMPARTDTRYWHRYVMRAKEVHLVKGRIKFELYGVSHHPAPFPSCFVVYDREGWNYAKGVKFYTMEKPK